MMGWGSFGKEAPKAGQQGKFDGKRHSRESGGEVTWACHVSRPASFLCRIREAECLLIKKNRMDVFGGFWDVFDVFDVFG